jgi:beta-mannosidase
VKAIGGEPTGGSDARLTRLQKAYEGAESLARGIHEHFGTDDDTGAEWYVKAQIVQARALRAGVGRFRSLHDTCSGALWWQFNDCWPGFSWSVEDVNGRRKLSYFAAREVMSARAVIPTADGSPHALTLVNDLAEPWLAHVTVRVIDSRGVVLSQTEAPTSVPADGHVVVGPGALPAEACAVIVDADNVRATRWVVADREMPATTARALLTAVWDDAGVWHVNVRAESMVRDLVLLTEFHPLLTDARVSTQLLVLLPGEEASFVVTGAAK